MDSLSPVSPDKVLPRKTFSKSSSIFSRPGLFPFDKTGFVLQLFYDRKRIAGSFSMQQDEFTRQAQPFYLRRNALTERRRACRAAGNPVPWHENCFERAMQTNLFFVCPLLRKTDRQQNLKTVRQGFHAVAGKTLCRLIVKNRRRP
jgi:hypothetical protein